MEQRPSWEWSDAWILASIGPSRRGDRPRSILFSADMLNHDIPTEAEMSQGLARLIASGLVVHRGDRFALTAAGARLTRHAHGRQFEIVDSLFALLREVPLYTSASPLPPALVLERGRHGERRWRPWTWTWTLPSHKPTSWL